MQRFSCPTCTQEVHFESAICVRCGTTLGFDPAGFDGQGYSAATGQMRMVAAYVPADGALPGAAPLCRNARLVGCNWVQAPGFDFCLACLHNRLVPDPNGFDSLPRWGQVEAAKRSLIYAILRWSLPHPTKPADPVAGLAFDFPADARNADGSITRFGTGHQDGVITLNLAEGDEVTRLRHMTELREPYRTVIGHLRHEIGHYYWERLVAQTPALDPFRALFGDERADYGTALQAHYANGAPADWAQSHISAYATAHPWEDFAETWAHWMHLVDGLETARAYGFVLENGGFVLENGGFALETGQGGAVATQPDLYPVPPTYPTPDTHLTPDPYLADDITALITAWVPLTVAINAMNRGMGQPDLYPFVLSQPVVAKMQFINWLIRGCATPAASNSPVI